MSAKTGIQWTDHTFNIAWGCTKVSPGCAKCYADRDATRYGFDIWGPGKDRRLFGEKHWNEPRKWNRAAEKAGVRARVFCSSMADVFEDHPMIDAERGKLSKLIGETRWLDWQILTKRAERMREIAEMVHFFYDGRPAKNVWFGVSVENRDALSRIDHLRETPAALRFVSFEPLLEDLGEIDLRGIDWAIIGGESGPGARPCDIAWIRSILAQCKAAGVACFVKQLGAVWAREQVRAAAQRNVLPESYFRVDRKGGNIEEWPEDLRVREMPQ